MKLICSQSDLSANISLVSRAVPSRPTHPVLANILLQADKKTNQVTLTAFDLSVGISTTFTAEVLKDGQIALPAKILTDIITKLPVGDITLYDQEGEGEGGGMIVTLKPNKGKYQVRAMSADEFPELPTIDNVEAITVKSSKLIEGLKGTLFATSSDELKQVLTGVHLTLNQESLEFAATDGHRLSVVQAENDGFRDCETKVTVPTKALRELQKMLGSGPEETVDIYIDQGQVVFDLGNKKLTSRTLEGMYPTYWQLIPKQFERTVTVERKQFIAILERVAVLAEQKNNIVKANIDSANQEIILSCESQDVGSAVESVPAQISGEDIQVAFNVKYLMEGLKEIPSSEIQININQELTPVIFTPLSGFKMTYLAMPVQVRN